MPLLPILERVYSSTIQRTDMTEHLSSNSKEVRKFLVEKCRTICDNVSDTTRPSATERMDSLIVVSLKNKSPHSSISDKAWAQFHVYVRDGANGTFMDSKMQKMIDNIKALDLQSELFLLNGGEPYETDPKPDGLGFHAVSIQYSITLIRDKVNNN